MPVRGEERRRGAENMNGMRFATVAFAAILAVAPPASAAETVVSPYVGHAPSPLFGAAICFTRSGGWPATTGWGCASAPVADGITRVTIEVTDVAAPTGGIAWGYSFHPYPVISLACGVRRAGPLTIPPGTTDVLAIAVPSGYCAPGVPLGSGGVAVFTLS